MPSEKDVEATWERASKVRGENPDVWRRDEVSKKIRKASYGTVGEFGWEVDHRKPVSKGGSDDARNFVRLTGNQIDVRATIS